MYMLYTYVCIYIYIHTNAHIGPAGRGPRERRQRLQLWLLRGARGGGPAILNSLNVKSVVS